jgi:DNA-directed RNA polymerase specialized sigma subunit
MSEHLDWERPKGESTPLTKLMHRLAPIVDDIVAGRKADTVCRDHGLSPETHAFIRKSLGLKKRGGVPCVPEERVRKVFNYTFEHTYRETAEHFGISDSTVCKYVQRACGVNR